MAEQNLANHGKFYPPFHFFVIPVFVFHFLWSINHWRISGFSWTGLESVVLAAAFLTGAFAARIMVLRVQDRVIRLEERLRYERILPADMRPRISEFTVNQMVSLRFASDAELPELARKVLDEKIGERKPIKQLIKNWRADYLRA